MKNSSNGIVLILLLSKFQMHLLLYLNFSLNRSWGFQQHLKRLLYTNWSLR